MFFIKPMQKNKGTPKYNHLIGKTAVVLEEIDARFGTGKVMLENCWWMAISKSPVISEGRSVTIVGVNGFTVLVEDAIAKQRKKR